MFESGFQEDLYTILLNLKGHQGNSLKENEINIFTKIGRKNKFSNVQVWSNHIGENVYSYNFMQDNLRVAIEISLYLVIMF